MQIDYSNLDNYLQAVQKEMREYQIRTVGMCKYNPRHIIHSPGGTGKTLMALTAAFIRRPKRIFVLCSANALYTWYKETQKWYPSYGKPNMYQVIDGTPKQRTGWMQKDTLFYVMTFKMFLAEWKNIEPSGWRPDVLLIDEYHRAGLRNKDAQFTAAVEKFARDIPCVHPMTGSTVSKGPQQLWAPLNVMDRKLFSSYWKFINTFCVIQETPFGKEIIGVQNTDGLRQIIKPYYSMIPQAEADAQRPKLDRCVTYVEMTPKQRKHHDALEHDMYTEIDSEPNKLLITASGMVKTLRLRQLLVCPKIIGIDDVGATIQIIADKIKDEQYDRTTIFTPFAAAIPYFKQYLAAQFPKMNLVSLQGGDKDFIKERTEAFRNKGGLAVCSIAFAQSYELETSQDIHFAGIDWDPENNKQAEWRVQRMTSDITKPIMSYLYICRDTVEAAVLGVNNIKTRDVRVTFQDVVKHYMERKANGKEKK